MSYPAFSSPFEEHLFLLQKAPGTEDVRQALVDVADTARGCKLWFEAQGIVPTGADIMTMTRMVLDREAAATNRRGHGEIHDDLSQEDPQ